jgi:hypothetical protein
MEPRTGTIKQGNTKITLEHLNMVADSWLGKVQSLCCFREAQGLGSIEKDL